MISGIYKILNIISGKFYIGSAINVSVRFQQHRQHLKHNRHKNKFIQSAYNLHRLEAFNFIVIEYCEEDKLLEREQYWLDLTQCYERHIGYNFNCIAGSILGFKHSDESREKMRLAKLGTKHSEQTKKLMSEAQTGRKHSEEAIYKMRAEKAYPNLHAERIGTKYNKTNRIWTCPEGQKCKCDICRECKNECTRRSKARARERLIQNE